MLLLKFMESKPRLLGSESSFTFHKGPDAFSIFSTFLPTQLSCNIVFYTYI